MIKKYNPIKDNIVNKIDEIRKEINRLSQEIEEIKRKTKESPRNIDYPKCPKCKSNKAVVKRGFRYNLGRGKIQKYCCKSCGNKFSKSNMAFYMRNSEVKIKKAIELFNSGFSYSQIANKIRGVSRQTIGRWLKKYNVKKPKERIIEREMKNQYGTYKRKFLIKYKPNNKKQNDN